MGWEDPDPADVVSLRGDSDWQAVRLRNDPNLAEEIRNYDT